MLIRSVELKNVKSYKHETIEFKEGINGICGMNGNGKTTILEAIGYVLFDYIPFNAGDLLRHGERTGLISVTIEGNDEIEYVITRKVGGSEYNIRTPVAEIRGKKDVTDWIGKNILHDISSSEDISSIFENAVGVPQGTFTTAFLLNHGPRKKIFDIILRVEEYQTAYTNLRSVINAIEKTIDSLDRELLPLKARTEKYQELKKEKDELEIEIESLKKEIDDNKKIIIELKFRKEDLTDKKNMISELSNRIKNDNIRIAERSNQLEKAKSELQRAQTARRITDELFDAEEAFKIETQIQKDLNIERIKRDRLKDEISGLDFKISSLFDKREIMIKLAGENNDLNEKKKKLIPLIEKAQKLEKTIKDHQNELKEPMVLIISELRNLREEKKRMEKLIKEIEEFKIKKDALLPLREKQKELSLRIKELKDDLEIPLRTILSEVNSLKEKRVQFENIKKEAADLINKKKKLDPEMEKQKALEDEIKKLSSFFETYSKLHFDLQRTSEKDEYASKLKSEIEELEKRSDDLTPLVEKQAVLEAKLIELGQQKAAENSRLKETKNKMKLAGTEGMCPVMNGIKCQSMSDFPKYFSSMINSINEELKDIEDQSMSLSKELDLLKSPRKQQDDTSVLIDSRRKEYKKYENAHSELLEIRKALKSLGSSYSLLGPGELSGTLEELNSIRLRLQSSSSEFQRLKKSTSEYESINALIAARNIDLQNYSDLDEKFAQCGNKISNLNSRFNLNIGIESMNGQLEKVLLDIKSLEKSLRDLNDPDAQIKTIETLIISRESDLSSLKEVPARISGFIDKLNAVNEKFKLCKRLEGYPDEIKLAEERIKDLNDELKALGSPDKEYEKLNGMIEKNNKELRSLENVPAMIDLLNIERKKLSARYLVYDGIDDKIASSDEKIANLEPDHIKYIENLPLSQKLNDYGSECAEIQKTIDVLNATLMENTRKQSDIQSAFSEQELNEVVSSLDELGKTISSKTEALKGQKKNLDKLSKEIVSMDSDILKIKKIKNDLENEKEFLSFSNFMRETIKNSSEFIVNEFIGEISQEAGNIYSELIGDYSSSLKWNSDYDIEIYSEGHSRSFRQLSGGERMSAALSVRLALLKALSNCDFIFLDEPTQNMDELRREKLSREITKIHGFKQIFVISHDDTFNEKYANIIRIEKKDGESRVVQCSI